MKILAGRLNNMGRGTPNPNAASLSTSVGGGMQTCQEFQENQQGHSCPATLLAKTISLGDHGHFFLKLNSCFIPGSQKH